MKLSRVDQYGRTVRLASARKAYASVAEDIKSDADVVSALGSLMESMAKIAEKNGSESVGPEEIQAAMERLADKGFNVEGSPEYFAANVEAIDQAMKTAGIWDSLGTGAQWMARQVGRGAEGLQQAPQALQRGWQAGQEALQKGWQTAKDVAGQVGQAPGQALEYVKQKAQDVDVKMFEDAKNQAIQSLQQARASFAAIRDVLDGRSNQINLPALRNFSTAMGALTNAATLLKSRMRPSVRPEQAGVPAGARSVSAPVAPAATPAAPAVAAETKKNVVKVSGWDPTPPRDDPPGQGPGTFKQRTVDFLQQFEEIGGPDVDEYIELMEWLSAEAAKRAKTAREVHRPEPADPLAHDGGGIRLPQDPVM